MSTAIALKRRPALPGSGGLTPNRFKKLVFNLAPAVMEFGLTIGAGTDPVVFTGAVDAPALKTLLEGCADLNGYSVDVYGSTEQVDTGPDGVPLYQGTLFVVLHGPSPYPAWGTALNSEVQSFVVVEGEAPMEPVESHYLVSGAGSPDFDGAYFPDGTLNGKDVFKKDDTHYLYFDGYWEGYCWVLHVFKSSLPGQIHQPGQEPFYFVYSEANSPPSGGWQAENGSSPAPTVTFVEGNGGGGTGYTLNAGANFQMGITEADLQANQRALGGDYGNAVVKGSSAGPTYPNVTGSGFINQTSYNGAWAHIGFTDGAPEFEDVTDGWLLRWNATTSRWEIWNPNGWIVAYDTGAGSINGWSSGPWLEDGGGAGADGGTISPLIAVAPSANFNSYFPFVVGGVAAPSATGTGATVSTICEHGSEGTLVTAAEADFDVLILLGLQLPMQAPSSSFTPNPAHWYAPVPATEQEALNRIAAMIYNWWLYSIPTLP